MPRLLVVNDNQYRKKNTGADFNRAAGILRDRLTVLDAADIASRRINVGFKYTIGTYELEVYLNGVLLRPNATVEETEVGDYEEINNYTIQINDDVVLNVGDRLRFRVTSAMYHSTSFTQITSILELQDTPSSYGEYGQGLIMNSDENSVEFRNDIFTKFNTQFIQDIADSCTCNYTTYGGPCTCDGACYSETCNCNATCYLEVGGCDCNNTCYIDTSLDLDEYDTGRSYVYLRGTGPVRQVYLPEGTTAKRGIWFIFSKLTEEAILRIRIAEGSDDIITNGVYTGTYIQTDTTGKNLISIQYVADDTWFVREMIGDWYFEGVGCTCYNTCYGYSACSCNNTCYGEATCIQCYNTCYSDACDTCDNSCYGYTTCRICHNLCYFYSSGCDCDNACYGDACFGCTCDNTCYYDYDHCTICDNSCYGYTACTCNSTCHNDACDQCDATCYSYSTCTCNNTCYEEGSGCSCNNTCYGGYV